MRWVGFGAGVVLVVATAIGVIFTLVLPRAHAAPQKLSIVVNRAVGATFLAVSRLARSYERVDALLAPIGPIALLAQLAAWLACFFFGFALMQWPFAHAFGAAAAAAGSDLFTVGLAGTPHPSNDVIAVIGAATGAITIALQIGYLPSIYAAFTRREALVTLLESRAGLPAWGPELLARHRLVGITDTLPELYDRWEEWAAEVSESHTTYPVLMTFRSPDTWYSWVLALLAVLDAAAIHLALNPESAPSQARLCLRMGFTALRRMGTALGWKWDADPLPDGPLSLTFGEFADAVARLDSVGFGRERSAEEAWPHFVGWRVNYEELAYRLADRTVAPPAPWSGARRHLRDGVVQPARPPHRAPGK